LKILLNVEGITCDHCVKTVKEAIIKIDGILSIEVDIEKKQVTVVFDEKIAKSQDVVEAIGEVGFEVMI
jgi:copper ion binding protein